jgi:hypothetical protein
MPKRAGTPRSKKMKSLILAVAASVGISGVVVAGQPTTIPVFTTKEECAKANMVWLEKGGKDGKGLCVMYMNAPGAKPADAKK